MVSHRINLCKRGHSLSDAYRHSNGHRYCRTCKNAAQRRRNAKRAARKNFPGLPVKEVSG